MKRAFVLLALVSACAHGPAKPEAAATPMKVETVKPVAPAAPPEPLLAPPLKTPAPLTLVKIPTDRSIVSLRFVFHTGSIDDPAEHEGLTALTARLMTEGGTRQLSSAQLLAELFPMAAELSEHVDKEMTVFEGRVHRDHLERFLRIFTDVLLEPRFDPKEFERMRADALNQIRGTLRGEDDETLGKTALDALLYAHHPYRHFVGGTVQGLTRITIDDVRAYARRVFTQDRLVIGLAGPVDDALARRVVERLAALPKTGAPLVQLPPVAGIRGHVQLLHKTAAATAISIGTTVAVRRGQPDFFPLAFAASYIGEHRQFVGVLMQQLRDARGFNYGDYAYAEHFLQDADTALGLPNVARAEQDFSLWLRPVEPPNAAFATRSALYYLHQLIDRGPEPERFENVRGFLLGYTRLWEQTDQRRLGYAIDDLFYGTDHFLDQYRAALATLTPQKVRDAVARNWSLDRLNAVYVVEDTRSLTAALKAPTEPPPSYPTPKSDDVQKIDREIAREPIPFGVAEPEVIEARDVMER